MRTSQIAGWLRPLLWVHPAGGRGGYLSFHPSMGNASGTGGGARAFGFILEHITPVYLRTVLFELVRPESLIFILAHGAWRDEGSFYYEPQ